MDADVASDAASASLSTSSAPNREPVHLGKALFATSDGTSASSRTLLRRRSGCQFGYRCALASVDGGYSNMRLVPVTCDSVDALESKCSGETLPAAESHSLAGCVSRHPAASMLRHGSMGTPGFASPSSFFSPFSSFVRNPASIARRRESSAWTYTPPSPSPLRTILAAASRRDILTVLDGAANFPARTASCASST